MMEPVNRITQRVVMIGGHNGLIDGRDTFNRQQYKLRDAEPQVISRRKSGRENRAKY